MSHSPEIKNKILRFLGIGQVVVGHTEKLVSAAGAFLGILVIFHTSSLFIPLPSTYLIVASMGASAVLLFAVPHGPLSQPWALIGGHFFSAIIGVTCARFIPDLFIAASVAVGLAVGLMYYLRCIHPPGGATALSAVVGGAEIHQLGYQYIVTPVLINVAAIFVIAIGFNYLFSWRRYPASLTPKPVTASQDKAESAYEAITHEDFVYALSQLDSFIDISEDDLLNIYQLVTQRQQQLIYPVNKLQLGHYYCNGESESLWSVRQIVDWSNAHDDGEEKLIYKVIAGADRRNTGVMSRNDFSRWTRYEVERDENNWRRVDEPVDSAQ